MSRGDLLSFADRMDVITDCTQISIERVTFFEDYLSKAIVNAPLSLNLCREEGKTSEGKMAECKRLDRGENQKGRNRLNKLSRPLYFMQEISVKPPF